jgi:hypothetical protein
VDQTPLPTHERLREIEVGLVRARQHPRLRQVSVLTSLTDAHLAAAECSRMLEYRIAAALVRRHHTLTGGTWLALARCARQLMPLPGQR